MNDWTTNEVKAVAIWSGAGPAEGRVQLNQPLLAVDTDGVGVAVGHLQRKVLQRARDSELVPVFHEVRDVTGCQVSMHSWRRQER